MKPIKSVCNKGIITEILHINGLYYVRKRQGTRRLAIETFQSLDLAARYFDFVRG